MINKILFRVFVFSVFSLNSFAQNVDTFFSSFKDQVLSIDKGVNFNDKLVLVSVWKSSDVLSRESNKEAFRVFKIYEYAKLKDGEKGTVFISLNLDENTNDADMAARRDSISSDLIFYNSSIFELLKNQFSNFEIGSVLLLNKKGELQFISQSKEQYFSLVRNLITR